MQARQLCAINRQQRRFLQQAQGRILHQFCGFSAFSACNLSKLSFLLGGEMHFHGLKAYEEPGC